MASIEERKSGNKLNFRVRYRYKGQQISRTFITQKQASTFKSIIDSGDFELAAKVLEAPSEPDLSKFKADILPTDFHFKAFNPKGAFVYILWGSDWFRPVYVGASTANVHRRIGDHLVEKGEHFDRVELIRMRSGKAAFGLEAFLIEHYRPPLNLVAGRSVRPVPPISLVPSLLSSS